MKNDQSCIVFDAGAFRSVFAAPEDSLILAVVDPGEQKELSAVADTAESIRRTGRAARLVVYGETSAALPGRSDVGFIEAWARPLFPAVLSAADLVIPIGRKSETLVAECTQSPRKAPVLLRNLGELRSHFRLPSAASKRRYLLQNDWGIGDELLLSAVAREIVRAYPGTDVWIRSRHGFRFPEFVRQGDPGPEVQAVDTIYQNPTLYSPRYHSPFPGHLVQQMLDKFTLDTGLKVRAVDLRPELVFPAQPKTKVPSVVLHSRPNPRLPSKDWGIYRWGELASILGKSGIRVRQVGDPKEPLLAGSEDLRGTPVAQLPGLVAESWVVVSLVGFLMHLAEAIRTPAVVIYGGREHPAIDGYPDQVHLSSGPLLCRGRWGCHLGPDLECPHSMKCMESLTPEIVAREVLSILKSGVTR